MRDADIDYSDIPDKISEPIDVGASGGINGIFWIIGRLQCDTLLLYSHNAHGIRLCVETISGADFVDVSVSGKGD